MTCSCLLRFYSARYVQLSHTPSFSFFDAYKNQKIEFWPLFLFSRLNEIVEWMDDTQTEKLQPKSLRVQDVGSSRLWVMEKCCLCVVCENSAAGLVEERVTPCWGGPLFSTTSNTDQAGVAKQLLCSILLFCCVYMMARCWVAAQWPQHTRETWETTFL